MGGPRGSFGGPEGQGGPGVDRRDPGGIEVVPGRFLRGPVGPLEKIIFSLLGYGFVNGLMKEILMFSVSCGFVKRSVVIGLCCFLLFFEAYMFAKQ